MSILFIWKYHYHALMMWCELWLYFTCYWIIILESADEMIFQFSCFECFVFYITKLTIMFASQFYSKMVVKSNCLFKKISETKKPKVSTCLYLLYLSIYGTACIKNIKSIFCLPIYYLHSEWPLATLILPLPLLWRKTYHQTFLKCLCYHFWGAQEYFEKSQSLIICVPVVHMCTYKYEKYQN